MKYLGIKDVKKPSKSFLATNGLIHEELLKIINSG